MVGRTVLLALALLCWLPAGGAWAQSSTAGGVTITSPKEGDSVVNTSAQFIGTAPPGTIVSIVITDTDTNRVGIAHQPGGKVEGAVTTGSDGTWAYVPQHTLVPGQFSVQASYTSDQNAVVNSKAVRFVVLNSSGSSAQFSSSLLRRLIVWGGLAILLIVLIAVFFVNRRHKLNLKRIDDNAQTIEHDLQETAEQLASTNARIAELNKQLDEQRKAAHSNKSNQSGEI